MSEAVPEDIAERVQERPARLGRRGAGARPAPSLNGNGRRPPFRVPEEVRRAKTDVDWDTFLPARAGALRWRVGRRVKRGLDIVLSLCGLLLLAPLFVLTAALVRWGSQGPVFYRMRAVGERGRPFIAWKFRTMVTDADALKPSLLEQNEMRGPVFKMREDPRVTRVGRWLRKTSIDELPQLWNVLKGEMSLVGPRPPFPEEFVRFEPPHRGKLAVTPGITCLWQVNGRSEIVDFEEWIALDLRYIREWSVWLDLKILARTIPAVMRGRGAY